MPLWQHGIDDINDRDSLDKGILDKSDKNSDKKHGERDTGNKEDREDKTRERALRRVRRLQSLITEMLPQPCLDRKTQTRLADELAEASDRLYTLSGQIEPVRKSED